MRLLKITKKTLGLYLNLFDLDIKGQGHSDAILILDTLSCLSTFTIKM